MDKRLVALVTATLLAMATAGAEGGLVCIQKDYNLYGHLYNTDDGTATGTPKPYCAPTATINSFIYLENKYPTIYDNLLTPRTDLEAREALRELMGGCAAGASDQEWWEGKVNYIQDYAPSTTVFDGMISTVQDVSMWVKGSVLENAYPTWEWLWKELADCEDIELKICAEDDSFCHALTLTSLCFDDADGSGFWDQGAEDAYIDYLDPNNPTALFQSELSLASGRLEFKWNNGGANPPAWVYLDGAFSESPVPEPTTLAIWGTLGGLGLVAVQRRRKQVA